MEGASRVLVLAQIKGPGLRAGLPAYLWAPGAAGPGDRVAGQGQRVRPGPARAVSPGDQSMKAGLGRAYFWQPPRILLPALSQPLGCSSPSSASGKAHGEVQLLGFAVLGS